MSTEQPTDLDYEIIKLIKWINERYSSVETEKNLKLWRWNKGGSFHTNIQVLQHYKHYKNAKH